jgi:leucyl-tRNA synthetase
MKNGLIVDEYRDKIWYKNDLRHRTDGPAVIRSNPDELRFYLIFLGHYFDGGGWSNQNLVGIQRFINRYKIWMSKTGEDTIDISAFKNMIFDYTENFKFNKVVSSFMTLLNENKNKNLTIDNKKSLIDLLNIYMPGLKI